MAADNNALICSLSPELVIALAQAYVIEYAALEQLTALPTGVPHCKSVACWRELVIPVLQFSDEAESSQQAIVLGCPGRQGQPQAFALRMVGSPKLVRVSDAEPVCELPDHLPVLFRELSISCFRNESGDAIPILDPQRLVGRSG